MRSIMVGFSANRASRAVSNESASPNIYVYIYTYVFKNMFCQGSKAVLRERASPNIYVYMYIYTYPKICFLSWQ